MKKKIIIDPDGIIFEPIDTSFKQTAIAEYGPAKGHMIALAYKYGLGRRLFGSMVENVLYKCASRPQIRPEELQALSEISQMPDVSIEFCSKIAAPQHADKLVEQYREIAPCMNAVSHYELISPFKSKHAYIVKSTAADKTTSNYVLDTRARYLQWPAKWRITPVLVGGNKNEIAATQREAVTARIFPSLVLFKEFLQHNK